MSDDPRSDLVAALLALRPKPAAAAFEAAVERIAAGGGVDPLALRELRWWHRASLEEVEAHVGEVLPRVWALLDQAGAAAADAHSSDEQAWRQAAALQNRNQTAEGEDQVTGPTGAPTGRRMVVGLTFLPED